MHRAADLPSVELGAADAVLVQEEIADPVVLDDFMNLYGKQKNTENKEGTCKPRLPLFLVFISSIMYPLHH
jgi:hypothetical protein